MALILLSSTALAIPPDAKLTLAPGKDKFLRAPIIVADVIAEPPGVVTVELLPSQEVMISANADAKGWTTVLAMGDRVYAWEVCISKCPPATDIQSAKSACPDLAQVKDDGKQYWSVTVKDVKCLDALYAALAHANISVDELRVSMDETPGMEFFHRVQEAIAADPLTHGIEAGYYGPTLLLKGTVPKIALTRSIMHAWFGTLGAVSFDDQTQPVRSATEGAK